QANVEADGGPDPRRTVRVAHQRENRDEERQAENQANGTHVTVVLRHADALPCSQATIPRSPSPWAGQHVLGHLIALAPTARHGLDRYSDLGLCSHAVAKPPGPPRTIADHDLRFPVQKTTIGDFLKPFRTDS